MPALTLATPDSTPPAAAASIATCRRDDTHFELHFIVPDAPVAAGRPRVALRAGHVHGYTPTKTSQAAWRIREHVAEKLGPDWKPLCGPIRLGVVVYLQMPASIPRGRRSTAQPARRPDLDNYLKTVLDGLFPVWVDDSQVTELSAAKRYAVGSAPRWEITIRGEVPDAECDACWRYFMPRRPWHRKCYPCWRASADAVDAGATRPSYPTATGVVVQPQLLKRRYCSVTQTDTLLSGRTPPLA